MPGREDLIQQNRSRTRTIAQAVSQPSQTAPGVPSQSTPTTSGTGSSPGSPDVGSATGGNINPSLKNNFSIKEKLLRPALTSHYQCWFNPPKDVIAWLSQKGLSYDNNNAELISLSCSEASLPGSSFMTNEITDDHTGITERHAYRRAYDDRADFTFYVDHGRSDGNYNVLWFFEKWMQYIANEQDSLGLYNRNFYHRVRYPEQYYTDELFINKFERDLAGQYLSYKFMQAYPISINSIPVSYESSDLLKCTVSFTYTRYITERNKNIQPTVQGANQNPDGSWNVDLFYGDRVETKTVTNTDYNKNYSPR